MPSRDVVIPNRLGLHARAAAKLVAVANRFPARVQLEKDGQRVNGKSIMGVMMLAASRGTVLRLEANGEDAQAAIDALVELIENRFGETE